MNEAEPLSPCVSICVLDERDICQGCFRSASEITDWLMASTVQKCEILQRAAQRRDDSVVIKPR
ncbi:MAG: DUF1289 domain-containing protein [Halioglobus sp.]|nr:DUF1289 domain-containing protein [Halioglobus sp.]